MKRWWEIAGKKAIRASTRAIGKCWVRFDFKPLEPDESRFRKKPAIQQEKVRCLGRKKPNVG